jgi:hypothetical protein
MGCFPNLPEELPVVFISGAIQPAKLPRIQNGLSIV